MVDKKEEGHPWIRFALTVFGFAWIMAFILSWVIFGIKGYVLDSCPTEQNCKHMTTSSEGDKYISPTPIGYIYYFFFGADLYPRESIFQVLLIVFFITYIIQIIKIQATSEKEEEELIINQNVFDPRHIILQLRIAIGWFKKFLNWRNTGILMLLFALLEIAYLQEWNLNVLKSLAPLIAGVITLVIIIVAGPTIFKYIMGFASVVISIIVLDVVLSKFGAGFLQGGINQIIGIVKSWITIGLNILFGLNEINESFLTFEKSEGIIFEKFFAFLGDWSSYVGVVVKIVFGLFLFVGHDWLNENITSRIEKLMNKFRKAYKKARNKFALLPKVKILEEIETEKDIMIKWDQETKQANDVVYLLSLIVHEKDELKKEKYIQIMIENINNYSLKAKTKELLDKIKHKHDYVQDIEQGIRVMIKQIEKEIKKNKK